MIYKFNVNANTIDKLEKNISLDNNFSTTKQVKATNDEFICFIYALAGIEIVKQTATDIYDFSDGKNIYERVRSLIVVSSILKKGFEGIDVNQCPSDYINAFYQVLDLYSKFIKRWETELSSGHVLFDPILVGTEISLEVVTDRKLRSAYPMQGNIKRIYQEQNQKHNKKLEIVHQNFDNIEKYYANFFLKDSNMFYRAEEIIKLFKAYKSSGIKGRKIANNSLWFGNKFNFPEGMNKALKDESFILELKRNYFNH